VIVRRSQLVWQKDACTAGRRQGKHRNPPCRQHRQQRTGVENHFRRTSERAAGNSSRRAIGDPALASATPQQRAAPRPTARPALPVPCIPGQPCPQAQQGNMQVATHACQTAGQLIAAKERERADKLPFASNLVYSRLCHPPQQQQQGQTMPAQYGPANVRQTAVSSPHQAEGNRRTRPEL